MKDRGSDEHDSETAAEEATDRDVDSGIDTGVDTGIESATAAAADLPVSGTGVPGVRSNHPDTLPPDEEGVSEAERTDDTGDDGWTARPGRPPRSDS